MAKISSIRIYLHEDQIAGIEPMMRRVRDAASAGKPGFLAAQIFSNHMRVFFIDHDRSMKFQALMGQPVGLTNKTPND